MTDPRKPIFDAVRVAAPGIFNESGNVLALDNLLDAFGVGRAGSTPDRRQLHKPGAFFDEVRKLTGNMGQGQIDSINRLLAAAAHHPIGWVAYELATAWHEARFLPQPEWGLGDGRPYGEPGKYGQKQYGRGFVQLTWDRNYEWADKALGLDGKLLANFDLALDPDIAARILVQGMEEGAFTGKALRHYINGENPDKEQFVDARRIVNGTDKAATIALHALTFLKALKLGGWR